VVNVESAITGHVAKPERMHIAPGRGAAVALKGHREMVFSADGIAQNTPVYDGSVLGAGDTLHGPAVIEEVTTTIVVEPGWTVSLHETGTYVLTVDQPALQAEPAKELVEA
jgi:N-methylhydantoinase A